jgi:hypothetical protein
LGKKKFNYKFETNFAIFWEIFHQFLNITKLKEKIILVVGECQELFLGMLGGSWGTTKKYCLM